VRRWLAAAGLLLLGCADDRVAQLEAELAKLEKERVPRAAVEEARRDAGCGGGPSSLSGARSARRRSGARATPPRAATRNASDSLSAADSDAALLPALQKNAVREREERARLDREIAAALERARALRDQAALIARQLRPGDPDWATERRLQVLDELTRQASNAYTDDPVLRELARDPPPAAAEQGRERADRLAARLTYVYALNPDL
jgi:hypothetical protein